MPNLTFDLALPLLVLAAGAGLSLATPLARNPNRGVARGPDT